MSGLPQHNICGECPQSRCRQVRIQTHNESLFYPANLVRGRGVVGGVEPHAESRAEGAPHMSAVREGPRGRAQIESASCGCGRGSVRDSLIVILCQIPRPIRYQVFSIENDNRSGSTLDAVVIYRLPNGHRQPLAFNLRLTSTGWAIVSIGLLQG